MLGVGFYYYRKNKTEEDYYVGGRSMTKWHIGLSVVATDVGGGFSIGLGGLGFVMGLSGSWLLFTGLLGAWIAGVILIPKVWKLAQEKKFLTFPQVLGHYYSAPVALIAGIISAIGYTGFTSSQILAGAKLADAAIPEINIQTAVITMGIIIVIYTALGGLKAVIYTDTIQWTILISGLIFIGIPVSYKLVGGWVVISSTLSPQYFSLQNISWHQLINWIATIVPIWFVGMTLYQRIYASKNKREAQKAWFIAGLFEWPVMAFMGVTLGLLARVAFENGLIDQWAGLTINYIDPEKGIPVLLVQALPVGLLGIMLSAYFSAIMSTADSCLMAASGNVLTDIFDKLNFKKRKQSKSILYSQIITLILGALALILALKMSNVLELMLYSYAFMVSGLFVPVLGALFLKKPHPAAAIAAMISGGTTTIILIITKPKLPYDLDPNVFGILLSFMLFFTINSIINTNK
ncbi:MAG: sodium:solute symporter family protein [Bacteroidales bacterium]|nr:sodium:solute symporter family protein [Bacteroidales bacterium]MCF8404611.1 sodium:solute symporter family protein [Bacteroidales bacterium]